MPQRSYWATFSIAPTHGNNVLSMFGVFQCATITPCHIGDGHHLVALANHRCGGLIVRLSIHRIFFLRQSDDWDFVKSLFCRHSSELRVQRTLKRHSSVTLLCSPVDIIPPSSLHIVFVNPKKYAFMFKHTQ